MTHLGRYNTILLTNKTNMKNKINSSNKITGPSGNCTGWYDSYNVTLANF